MSIAGCRERSATDERSVNAIYELISALGAATERGRIMLFGVPIRHITGTAAAGLLCRRCFDSHHRACCPSYYVLG